MTSVAESPSAAAQAVRPVRVTAAEYWATLDALTKARAIEEQKAAQGEAALAAWWTAAEPRWRELSAVLDRAEAEDWVRASVWFDLWREARRQGKEPGTVNVPVPPGSTNGQGGLIPGREVARSERTGATAPRRRRISSPA